MAEELFPFPIFLTTMHMASAMLLACTLHLAAPSFFPTAHVVFQGQDGQDRNQMTWSSSCMQVMKALVPFWGIAGSMVVSLAAGNTAYKFASVSFLQMLKEGHIVIVYFMMVVFGLDVARLRNVLVIGFIAVMSALATSGSGASFSLPALLWQTLAGLGGAMQMVLTNRMMSKSTKLDPMTMVLCTAPTCLLFLLPLNAVLWDARILPRLCIHPLLITGSCCLAFCLQISTVVLIRNINAVGHALSSIAKDLMIVSLATVLMGDQLTHCQIVGFSGTIVGISFYSFTKLFPEQFDGAKVEK